MTTEFSWKPGSQPVSCVSWLSAALCALALLAACGSARATDPDVEADWRKQDGIGTARQPSTYAAAIQRLFQRGDALLQDLRTPSPEWEKLKREWRDLQGISELPADSAEWENLWRRAHELRRKIAFGNPLARTGPLLFIKQAPGTFSHQLTQVYGRYARPGGGLCVLEAPGESLACRTLAAADLGEGSFQTAEVSFDGRTAELILFGTEPAEQGRAGCSHDCDPSVTKLSLVLFRPLR